MYRHGKGTPKNVKEAYISGLIAKSLFQSKDMKENTETFLSELGKSLLPDELSHYNELAAKRLNPASP